MNWFMIRVEQGKETYAYGGSSPYNLDALGEQAAQGKYIRLENLVFPDGEGVKPWEAYERNAIPTILINPSAIVTIIQFTSDPHAATR